MILRTGSGQLAQLAERLVDVEEVIGSSPILPTPLPSSQPTCGEFLFSAASSFQNGSKRDKPIRPRPQPKILDPVCVQIVDHVTEQATHHTLPVLIIAHIPKLIDLIDCFQT